MGTAEYPLADGAHVLMSRERFTDPPSAGISDGEGGLDTQCAVSAESLSISLQSAPNAGAQLNAITIRSPELVFGKVPCSNASLSTRASPVFAGTHASDGKFSVVHRKQAWSAYLPRQIAPRSHRA
jgi:hypothetical protein